MSWKRMNVDEKSRYLIGLAVMRQIEHAPRDPETMREIAAVMRWVAHWLTPDELHYATIHTGVIFDDEIAEELGFGCDLAPSRIDLPDDDVPF